jgi:hypothetical protein
MPINYRPLTLPKNPIKKLDETLKFLEILFLTRPQVNISPKAVLTDEVQDIFNDLKIKISCLTFFHFATLPRDQRHGLLHSDIVLKENIWTPVTCSVNWELTGDDVEFCWYNTTREPCYPTDPKEFNLNPQGIHFTNRGQLGIFPETDTLIESVNTLENPLLLRTNVPHQVYSTNKSDKSRFAVSIRFEPDFDTWENAVEFFKPITKE